MSSNHPSNIMIFQYKNLVILDTIKKSLSSLVKIQLNEKSILLQCEGDSNDEIHQFSYKKLKIIAGNSYDTKVLQSDGLKLEYAYSINIIVSDRLFEMIATKNAIFSNSKSKRGRSSLTPIDTLRKPPRSDAATITPSIKKLTNLKNTLFMDSNSPVKTSGIVSRMSNSLEGPMHSIFESKSKQSSLSPMNSRSTTTLIDRPPLKALPSSKSGVTAAKICHALSLLATTPAHSDSSSPLTPPSRTSNSMSYTQKPLSQNHTAAKQLQYKSTRLEFMFKEKPRSSAAVFENMRLINNLNDTTFFHDDRMLIDQNISKQSSSSSSKEANSHIGTGTGSPGRFQPLPPSAPLPRSIWKDFPRSKDTSHFYSSNHPPREVDTGLGLRNLGNSCYMSAVLQALRSLEGLVKDMCSPLWSTVASTVQQKQTSCFVQFAIICGGFTDRKDSDLSALKLAVDAHSQLFRGYRQHDAHEFLCDLLQMLSEEMQSSLSRLLLSNISGYNSSSSAMTFPSSDPSKDKENLEPFLNTSFDPISTITTTASKSLAHDNKKQDNKSNTTTTSTESTSSSTVWSEEDVLLRLPPRRRFHAEVITRIRCCHCNHKREKKELYRDFSLDLTTEETETTTITTTASTSKSSSTSMSSSMYNNATNATTTTSTSINNTPRNSSIIHIVTPESSSIDLTNTTPVDYSWKKWKVMRGEKEEVPDHNESGKERQNSSLQSLFTPPPLHKSIDLTMSTSPLSNDFDGWPPADPPVLSSTSYQSPSPPPYKTLQIEDLLSSFFRPEICSLQCDECQSGEEGMAEVTPQLYGLPDVLILHLKRFRFDERTNKFSKSNAPVTFPLQLTIPTHILHMRSGEIVDGFDENRTHPPKNDQRRAQRQDNGGIGYEDDMIATTASAEKRTVRGGEEVEGETEIEVVRPMLGIDLTDVSGLHLGEMQGGAGSTVSISTELLTVSQQIVQDVGESSAPLTLSQVEEKDFQEALRLSLLGDSYEHSAGLDIGLGVDSQWLDDHDHDIQEDISRKRGVIVPSSVTDNRIAKDGDNSDSWICLGCTFINSDLTATCCSICETSRKLEQRPKNLPQQQQQQPQPPKRAISDGNNNNRNIAAHKQPWENEETSVVNNESKKRIKIDHPLSPLPPQHSFVNHSNNSNNNSNSHSSSDILKLTPYSSSTSTSTLFTTIESTSSCSYTLKAVVRHLGSESTGGHYICDILQPSLSLPLSLATQQTTDALSPEGVLHHSTSPSSSSSSPPLWRRCDDSTITYITQAQLLSEKSSPYIFFYSMN